MSQKKCKLVLKAKSGELFAIAKSVNTLEFGVPGDVLTRKEVDRILIDNKMSIQKNMLTVEFST